MRHEHNFWVVGGDMRQAALASLLIEDGHTVHTFALEKAEGMTCEKSLTGIELADCVVLPLPAVGERGILNAPMATEQYPVAWVLDFLRPGQLVCGGMLDQTLQTVAAQRSLNLQDYFAREELAVANAVPDVFAKW